MPESTHYTQPPAPEGRAGEEPKPPAPVSATRVVHRREIFGKEFIPIMHPCVAGFLCAVNCILPGFGTIIAGFLALCGAANPGSESTSAAATFCMNLLVGFLQILTIAFFLLGWVWSILWGILFITQSSQWGRRPVVTTTTYPPASSQGVRYSSSAIQPPTYTQSQSSVSSTYR
eukprot:m.2546 g.2546  ORF g.2546 m.2546 type:complete len:174 (-) comp1851_c0_seq1:222-743(-)